MTKSTFWKIVLVFLCIDFSIYSILMDAKHTLNSSEVFRIYLQLGNETHNELFHFNKSMEFLKSKLLSLLEGRVALKRNNETGDNFNFKTNGSCENLTKFDDILFKINSVESRIKSNAKKVEEFIGNVTNIQDEIVEEFRRELRSCELFFMSYERAIDDVTEEEFKTCSSGKCESKVFQKLLDCGWVKPDKRTICRKEMELKKSKMDQMFRLGLNKLTVDINLGVYLLDNVLAISSELKKKCEPDDCHCIRDIDQKYQKQLWDKLRIFNRTDWTSELKKLLTAQKEGLPNYEYLRSSTVTLVRIYSCCLNESGIIIKGYPCEKIPGPTTIHFPTVATYIDKR